MFLKRLRKKGTKRRKRKTGVSEPQETYISSSESSGELEEISEQNQANGTHDTHPKEDESNLHILHRETKSFQAEDYTTHKTPITCVTYGFSENIDNFSVWFGDKYGNIFTCHSKSDIRKMIEKHEKCVLSICFSEKHKKIFSSGDDGRILFWEPFKESCVFAFERAHKAPIFSLSTANDLLFAASADRTITVWNLQERILVHTFYGPLHTTLGISANSRDCFFAVGLDCTPRYYQVEQCKFSAYERSESYIECVCSVSDNIFACGTSQGHLLVYDTAKNKAIIDYSFSHHFGFIGDGTGFEKESLRLPIEAANQSNGNPIWCIASIKSCTDATGKDRLLFATGSNDGYIKIWEVRGTELFEVAQARVDGIIVAMSYHSATKNLIVAVSKEPRTGRWNTWCTINNRIVTVHLGDLALF